MKINPRAFPHPVLSRHTDDVLPNEFQVDLIVTPTKTDFVLEYHVLLDHTEIRNLVTSGDAKLVIHIECQSNFYRKAFSYDLFEGSLTIPVFDLTGKVEVSFVIVAGRSNAAYRIEGMHADYGSLHFSLSGSDILAFLETKYFIAEKDPDVLKRISSIIQVAELGPGKKSWEIDLGDVAKIYVRMSQADMQSYHMLRSSTQLAKTLISVIVIPALVEALHYIKNTNNSDLEVERQRRWFTLLENRISALGINLHDNGRSMYEIAQEIMEGPSARVLPEMDNLIENGD